MSEPHYELIQARLRFDLKDNYSAAAPFNKKKSQLFTENRSLGRKQKVWTCCYCRSGLLLLTGDYLREFQSFRKTSFLGQSGAICGSAKALYGTINTLEHSQRWYTWVRTITGRALLLLLLHVVLGAADVTVPEWNFLIWSLRIKMKKKKKEDNLC